MIKSIKCVVLAVLAPGALADAQCLDLEAALDRAALRDPAVRIALADLENAEAGLQDAKSLRRPQISTFGRTGFGDVGLVDTTIENQIGLRASQRIIDFGDSRLAKQASREDILAQQSFVTDARHEASLDVGIAYLRWAQAVEDLAATAERIAFFTRQLTAVEALLETGGATRLEQAEVASEVATAQAEQFEFEFQKQQAATEVAITTGSRAPLCLPTGNEAALSFDAESNPPDALPVITEQALQTNARLEALRRSTSSLEATAKREARARLPIVDVVGISSFASENFETGLEFQNRVGVNVSVPLFSGNALTARRRQAAARAQRAEGQFAAAERVLRQEIEVTYQRMRLLAGQLLRRQDVVSRKSDQLEAAGIEYDQGLRTLPELIEIRLELEDAALQEIATRYALLRERLRFNAMTGAISPADGTAR